MQKPIIVLTGPTASGKTAFSFEVAKDFAGEIIAADSMTVYRGMDIGTDKPTLDPSTKKENSAYLIHEIPHHLIDVLDPSEEFNVSIFKDMVTEKVAEIRRRGNIPFLVGGSTLYLDAFVYDYHFPHVEPDTDLRAQLEAKTKEELFEELVELDPDVEWTIDKNNKRRLVRALEVIIKTGRPFAEQKAKKELPSNILYLAVERDREELYERINKRVDEMMDMGFLDEVRKLYKKYDHNTAMQAAGYKQLSLHLDEKMPFSEAVEKTKQVHRNFAKRQITWLRGNPDITWIKSAEEAKDKIKSFLGK